MVIEVWVEPQCGKVGGISNPAAFHLQSLQYHQVPNAVSIATKFIQFLTPLSRMQQISSRYLV